MKQIAWAVVATAGLVSLGTTVADAAATCKMLASMCPSPPDNNHGVTRTSVPEPASLLLLGAGVTAVGAAVARRRKHNKDG